MRVLLLSLGLLLFPLPSSFAETSANRPDQAWPATVKATYSLRFNGIEVGQLKFKSTTTADTYSLSSSAKVSVFFGAFKWSGSGSASGAIEGGAPAPAAFNFDWRRSEEKNGKIRIGFKERVASEVAIKPPPRPKPDTVPLLLTHKTGVLDPMSSVLMLLKADNRPPCDRRLGIFDGKQRYDIVFTPKRVEVMTASAAGGRAETTHVCRVTYEPIAGHRDNEDTKQITSNRDVEVVLRRVPGSQMLILHSVTVPTAWGTGYMVADKVEVITAGAGKIALTN